MKTHPIRAMLWKDYRLVRPLLLVGLILIIVSCNMPFLTEAIRAHSATRIRLKWDTASGEIMALCAVVSALLMPLLGAVLPANERADRSSAFLVALPPSRRTRLASKAIVGLGAMALVVALNAAILAALLALRPESSPHPPTEHLSKLVEVALMIGGTWVLMFCGAWLAGWIVASPAIATVIGIGMPIILGVALFTSELPEQEVQLFYWGGALGLGAVFFLLGGAIALWRTVES